MTLVREDAAKKTQPLFNLGARGAAKPLPPSSPTTAEECAAAEEKDSPVDVMDDDEVGYSSCSEGPQDRAFGKESGWIPDRQP